VIFTSWIPELQNAKKEPYGYKRLQECFFRAAGRKPREIIEHLKNTASQWVQGRDPEDDITFVVIRKT